MKYYAYKKIISVIFCIPDKVISFILGILNKNTQKIVLISFPRSGSNLLLDTLGNSKNIENFNEIFNHDSQFNIDRWKRIKSGYLRKKLLKFMFSYFPISYLNLMILSTKSKKYVCFKYFFKQQPFILYRITRLSNTKKMFLYRENVLKNYVSLMIASENKIWSLRKESNKVKKKISVDFDKFMIFYHNQVRIKNNILNSLENVVHYKTTYEQLVKNKLDTINNALTFLDLPIENIKSDLQKQNSDDLSEIIINYSEIRKKVNENLPNEEYI